MDQWQPNRPSDLFHAQKKGVHSMIYLTDLYKHCPTYFKRFNLHIDSVQRKQFAHNTVTDEKKKKKKIKENGSEIWVYLILHRTPEYLWHPCSDWCTAFFSSFTIFP